MIKGVIFDFDNTLYNYDYTNKYALSVLFKEMSSNLNINIEEIENVYKKMNKNIKNSNNPNNKFNKLIYIKQLFEYLNIPIHLVSFYCKLYSDVFFVMFKIYDGVLDLFSFLKTNNIKIGILSNNHFSQQLEKLDKFGLIKYIDVIQTSDECGEEKPNKYMFLSIQSKMNIQFNELAYIGDNFEDDIEPCIEYGMIPFWFNSKFQYKIVDNIIQIGNFHQIQYFFHSYLNTVDELIFLSKYFGQSILNVQGAGGNISVKQDDILFIKSSGYILGNVNYNEGYCLIDNNSCIDMVKENDNSIKNAKLFGFKMPSMETYFHSFMKKYTLHLHFTLSNIWFCSNKQVILDNFAYNYEIVDYFKPGIELAVEIHKLYKPDCNIYFLKNHGIIITADNKNDIMQYYEYIFDYFNKKCNNKYENELLCFKINEIYNSYNKKVVVRNIDFPVDILENIVYCFPDLAIFIPNIKTIQNLEELNSSCEYEVIICKNNIYIVAESITKLYSITEILNSYKILYFLNDGNLSSVNNIHELQNMPEEKNRKNC